MKILPLEELENLDVPSSKESNSPVNKVIYISENDTEFLGGNNDVLSRQDSQATRFNLFTGNQTLYWRENSFKVISCVAHVLRFWLIYCMIIRMLMLKKELQGLLWILQYNTYFSSIKHDFCFYIFR